MLYNVPRAARDLLFYGDFEIIEQVASISEADQTNVVGYKPGRTSAGGLLLSAPLGVGGAPPTARRDGDERPEVRDGRVWGAGAVSGRLSLLCQLVAASSFRRGELARPVMVAGTFGEEHRGSGTRFLLESGHLQPGWVVVGAPTNLEIVRGHRGYLVFEVELEPLGERWQSGFPVRGGHHVVVPGVEAPSALPRSGRSALARGLDLVRSFEGPHSVHGFTAGSAVNRVPGRCEFDLLWGSDSPPEVPWDAQLTPLPEEASVSIPHDDCLALWTRIERAVFDGLRRLSRPEAPEFEPGGPLVNVGQVRPTARGLAFLFDYRPLPGEEPYGIFREVERIVEEVTAGETGLRAEVRVTVNRPAMEAPEDAPLALAAGSALESAGLLPVQVTCPQYTDGGMYSSCELETIVLGPGWWGDAGALRESISVQQLELAVRIYEDLIRRLCGD